MEPSPLTIHLFGPLRVTVRGAPLARVRTRSVEWLLALLALRHGRPVPRAWLAGTLWPESEESRSLQNLRDDLMRLRQALGPEGERIQSPARHLLTLDLSGAEVDVLRFDAGIQAGDEPSLHEAVAVHTGPLLEGCAEEWVMVERETRAEQCLAALETLADRATERRDHRLAIRYLKQAEALDPLRDFLQQRLMANLAAAGDPAAAIQTYRNFRIRLQEALIAQPDEATTRLFHEIRASARETAALGSDKGGRAYTGPDARRHAPGAAAEGGPPSAGPAPAALPGPVASAARAGAPQAPGAGSEATIPHVLTPLIGREQEVAEVREQLRQHRLVTLTGGGGVGKTRLALEMAATAGEVFPSGAVWVELAPLADGTLVLSALATALGLRETGSDDPEALRSRLIARLAEAGRGSRVLAAERTAPGAGPRARLGRAADSGGGRSPGPLLVLDNCEHLVDAAAAVVQMLLQHCPDLHVLATSRQRLALPGEVAWRVPSLMQAAAVRLFVERAVAARPEFQLASPEDALAVDRICRRLDGIPLALELAAARARVLAPQQIVERLDDRFNLLTTGARTARPRHQTLRALIDWSYDGLPEAEAALLRRLSVFAGGWTLEAAEAVCRGPGDALDLLAFLEDRSLVLAEEAGEARFDAAGVSAAGRGVVSDDPVNRRAEPRLPRLHSSGRAPGEGMRYRMLETVREYAREKLRECGEEASARADHAAFFLSLAEQAGAALERSEGSCLDQLETEHDNFRAALRWYLEARDAPSGLRLAAALAPFWELRFYLAEGQEWLENILTLPAGEPRFPDGEGLPPSGRRGPDPGAAPDAARARALLNVGRLARRREDRVAALRYWEEGLAIRRLLGDRHGIAELRLDMGQLQGDTVSASTAAAWFEESLAYWREVGDRAAQARTLFLQARLATNRSASPEARALHAEAAALHRELGDLRNTARNLRELGRLSREMGDYAAARAQLEETLSIERQLGNRLGVSETLLLLGQTAFVQGDTTAARACWEEVLAIDMEKMGHSGYVTVCLANLDLVEGDLEAARARCDASLAWKRAVGPSENPAQEMPCLAELALREGDETAARRWYEECVERFEASPEEEWEAIRHRATLWRLLRRQGDTAASRTVYEQALAYHETLTNPLLIAHSKQYLGIMAGPEGDRSGARRFLIESLSWGRLTEHLANIIGCLQGLVELAVLEGEWERAARLGAAASAHDTQALRSRPLLDQIAEEAILRAICAALGEARFAAAWAEGRALTLAQAIEEARSRRPSSWDG